MNGQFILKRFSNCEDLVGSKDQGSTMEGEGVEPQGPPSSLSRNPPPQPSPIDDVGPQHRDCGSIGSKKRSASKLFHLVHDDFSEFLKPFFDAIHFFMQF